MLADIKNSLRNFCNSEDDKLLNIVSIIGICAVVVLFHIFYFNRFLPPLDGWFNVVAAQIKSGMVPYRDFSFCLPPFYLYKINIINAIFGDALINMRIYGIIERCFICIFLFLSLRSITTVKWAFMATIAGFVCMTSVTYELISSPVQSSVLCSVIVLYMWIRTVKANKAFEYYLYMFLIGLFSFECFQYKQTTGLLIGFASFVLVFLITNENYKKLCIKLVAFLSGLLIPLGIFYAYLYNLGALNEYFHQLFMDAAGEKGGILHILLGLFAHNFSNISYWLLLFFIIGFFAYIKLIEHKTKDYWEYKIEHTNIRNLVLLTSSFLFLVLGAFVILYKNIIRMHLSGDLLNTMGMVASSSFLVTIIIGCYALYKLFVKREKTSENNILLIFAGLSFGILIASGLSIFFDVNVTVISVGLLVVFLYNLKLPIKIFKDTFISILTFFLVFCCAYNKYQMPYRWWGWTSFPVTEAKNKIDNIPQLKGFILSNSEADIVRDIYKLSQNLFVNDNDYIYCFPDNPLGHYLSGRIPKEVSPFPHIDVYSDERALKEAKFIKNNPPKIIFYVYQSKVYWTVHEKIFRAGKECGQREIERNINELINDKKLNYELVGTYKFCETKLDPNKDEREMLYIYYRK